MKNKQAFTLIELLVVVLIIGILAAVALPQYQKAVEKSRAAQAITLLKSISQAADVYYIATGSFPTSLDELDIEFPADWTGNEEFYNKGHTVDAKSDGKWSVVLENDKSRNTYIIWLGQLTGKYRGTGFGYYPVKQTFTTAIPTNTLLCLEGDAYSGTAGGYCEKLWRGSEVYHNSLIRIYTIMDSH